MNKKVIGILGGMGPLATADLFRKIILNEDASCDQEHLRVCIDSNTAIPDRTAALLHGGESPLPELKKSIQRLEQVGAEVLIFPCNTSHAYFDEITAAAHVPVLHMIRLTRDALLQHGIRRCGLLATDGAVQTEVYQKEFSGSGIELLLPDPAGQRAVMGVIYDGVKAGVTDYDTAAFARCIEDLLARGAETLILGCTELPPAFSLYHLDYPAVDPTLELALGAIRFAGGRVRE